MKGTQRPRRGCQLSLQAGECIKAWHFWCARCRLPMPNLEKWWWDWKLIWLQGEWDGSRGSMYMLVPRPSWISKPLGPWKTLYLVWGTGNSPEWGQFDLELTEPQFIVHQQRHAASFDWGITRAPCIYAEWAHQGRWSLQVNISVSF